MEIVDPMDDPKTSRPIGGYGFPNIEMLDAKITSGPKKIILISYFMKKVSLEEQKAQMGDRCLRGRQNVYMLYENFRVSGAQEAVLNTDLVQYHFT